MPNSSTLHGAQVPLLADTFTATAGAIRPYPGSPGALLESDFTDIKEEKTYFKLEPTAHDDHSPIPSPTRTNDAIFDQIMVDSVKGEPHSWERVHPQEWSGQQIVEWVYHVVEEWDFDPYNVHGEKFSHLMGQDLATMSRKDFLNCDPNYGDQFFECFQNLLSQVQFKPPRYSSSWDGISSSSRDANDSDCDMQLNEPHIALPPLSQIMYGADQALPYHAYDDAFSEITDCCRGPSDSDSELDSTWPGTTCILPPAVTKPTFVPPSDFTYRDEPPPYQAPVVSSTTPTVDKKRRPGRPPKVYNGVQGQRSVNRPGRKQGQVSKGQTQLWKFIRSLLLSSEHNPNLIRWENRDDGVFRIINSEEVARMWGSKKNNEKMTYEKMSRAMRFCRDQGYFSEVPKEGNYPKKLCFRFGEKATDWH